LLAEGRSGISSGPLDDIPAMDTVISDHIRRVLGFTKGRVHGKCGAADILRMNPSTLRYRMDKLGLTYGKNYRK